MTLTEKTVDGEFSVAPSADEVKKREEEQKIKTQPLSEMKSKAEEKDPEDEVPVEGDKKSQDIEIEVTDEDVDRYVYAACRGERYLETYKLLGGRMEVTLRSISVDEVKQVNNHATALSQDSNWAMFQLNQQMSFMAMHLHSYGSEALGINKMPDDFEKRFEIVSKMQDFLYLAINEKVIHFGLKEDAIKKK